MAGSLRSQKDFPFRKLIGVGEFYELTASTDICPFILHLFDLALVIAGSVFKPLFPLSAARKTPRGLQSPLRSTTDLSRQPPLPDSCEVYDES